MNITESKNEPLPLRPCVGITLFNQDGKVFVGERVEHEGAWQMPQGGIDKGETVEDAFFRELLEETGIENFHVEILKVHHRQLDYTLPPHLMGRLWNGKWGGQTQTWVAGRFSGDNSEIDVYHHHFPEFNKWQWITLDEMLDMIIHFKRNTYEEVVESFREFE